MINYLIELSGVHIALILGYWFFLRNEQQYSKMRSYLIASTLLALAVPLVRLPALSFGGNEPATLVGVTSLEAIVTVPATTSFKWNYDMLLWIYLGVSALFLIKLVNSILQLMLLERKSVRERVHDLYICKVPGIRGSFTFFNRIFLGEEIDEDHKDYDAIVRHEKAHVSLGHSYDVVFFELFKVCFWWIPTAWFINREIRKIHEYQADACALKSCDVEQYTSAVIRSTLKSHGLGLASSFHGSFILKRLMAMEQPARNLRPWKLITLSALCITLFVVFACREDPEQGATKNDARNSEQQGDIYVVVESLPEFEGGMDALNAYVASELEYPQQARRMGIEGRVDVQFVVEKDGSLSDVKAVKGIGAGCDAEAVRVVQSAPRFKPGMQRGKAVRVRMEMPILFQLDKSTDETVSPRDKNMVGDLQPRNNQFKVEGEYSNGEWTGTVYDEEGNGLPGVNIVVAGTTRGTVTGSDGTFKINADKSQVLNLSFVGYESVRLEGNRQ